MKQLAIELAVLECMISVTFTTTFANEHQKLYICSCIFA
jgi:hypothetical protein